MGTKDSLLSRLFKFVRDGAEEPEKEETEQAPFPAIETETESRPAGPLLHRLELSQNHVLFKLWALYCEEAGWQPKPELVLEGASGVPLPDAVGSAELVRLRMLVNTSSQARYEQIRNRQKALEDEKSPPVDLDAQAVVFLAKDGMTAWVLVYPPAGGGKALDREILDQALKDRQICFGLDEALLDALPQEPERYFKLFAVAKGVEAVPGANGHIVDLFPRIQERKLKVDEHDRIDYKNLDFIHSVEKGGAICSIIPPGEGTPGRTVQGQEVIAKDGKPETIPKGRNTELSEDGSSLIASISGRVEFSGRSFHVNPVLTIPGNVDYSVGNINFLGDVSILGDVLSGFSVRATGTVTVGGVVEASSVEAGRDLVIAKGIQGDGKAVLRAQGSVFVKYMENCYVYAKVNIETECIINCEVYCGGGVTVRSGYGKIIGGKIHAAHEVYAGMIGSRVGNRTNIILGGDPCEEFDYQILTAEIEELEASIKFTEGQPDSPDRTALLTKMQVQLKLSRARLQLFDKERALHPSELQEPGVRRMRCDTAFPGTVLTVDGLVRHINDMVSPCFAELRDGEICLI